MPVVFSEEVHSALLTVIPSLAIVVGVSVIILSVSKRTASLSTYRYFILNFSAWDTALAIVCGLAQMKPFPCHGLFMGKCHIAVVIKSFSCNAMNSQCLNRRKRASQKLQRNRPVKQTSLKELENPPTIQYLSDHSEKELTLRKNEKQPILTGL